MPLSLVHFWGDPDGPAVGVLTPSSSCRRVQREVMVTSGFSALAGDISSHSRLVGVSDVVLLSARSLLVELAICRSCSTSFMRFVAHYKVEKVVRHPI